MLKIILKTRPEQYPYPKYFSYSHFKKNKEIKN